MRFGHGGLVGFGYRPEAGADSWQDHRDAGRCTADGVLARLIYWLKLNIAYNYINGLRKSSNEPPWLLRMAQIERRLSGPLHQRASPTPRAAFFQAHDHHAEPDALPPALLGAMRDELMGQHLYHDPVIPGWTYRGMVEAAPYSELHMLPHALFASDFFLEICTSPTVVDFCREVMGPRAAISWGQAWIGNPGYLESPKWKWHRNNDEPFNAVQVLVPLGDVLGKEDGPMLVLPGSSHWPACLEPRLHAEDEVEAYARQHPPHALLGQLGAIAFLRGFALHRLTPVLRRQATLAIMVSIGPALGTPTIMRRPLSEVPQHLRARIAQNAVFFHRLVC
jgi:hypothetical protein